MMKVVIEVWRGTPPVRSELTIDATGTKVFSATIQGHQPLRALKWPDNLDLLSAVRSAHGLAVTFERKDLR